MSSRIEKLLEYRNQWREFSMSDIEFANNCDNELPAIEQEFRELEGKVASSSEFARQKDIEVARIHREIVQPAFDERDELQQQLADARKEADFWKETYNHWGLYDPICEMEGES